MALVRYNVSLPEGEKTKRNRAVRWSKNFAHAMQRDGGRCVLCGSTKDLEMHHINTRTTDQEQDHGLENLMTVCRQCHKAFHWVHLLKIDGQWHVRSPLFKLLGLSGSVPITE